jgi:hypothetical protein
MPDVLDHAADDDVVLRKLAILHGVEADVVFTDGLGGQLAH